jgi:hypothetical protein
MNACVFIRDVDQVLGKKKTHLRVKTLVYVLHIHLLMHLYHLIPKGI